MTNHQDKRISKRTISMLAVSLLLWSSISLCYWFRPDSCAAITFWPTWVWLIPGLVFILLGWNRCAIRPILIVMLLWIAYSILFTEEIHSIIRFQRYSNQDMQVARSKGQALRVVSLNCAGGSIAAADEVIKYRPDIVLLQESPSQREVRQLARRIFGKEAGFVWGIDTSILARGDVQPKRFPSSLDVFALRAQVILDSGIKSEVISIRLVPPLMRTDIWSLDCWKQQAVNRRIRRRQVEELAKHLRNNTPLLVGGDFNAPAGDGAFESLQLKLRDTFRDGGIGWGNTVLNDFPVLRFDQVWITRHFETAAVVARKTKNSDHRIVICDLFLKDAD